MTTDDVLQQLNSIFRHVLDNEDIVLTSQTTAADVEGWDSLSHVQLVVAVEKHFKIKFTSKEIFSFKNVADMCDAIRRKQAA
jgi:acyl carrier protein